MSSLKTKLKNTPWFYTCYLFFLNRNYYNYRKREKVFFKKIIQPKQLVFDIGANLGDKAETFRLLGAKVIAVEPDASNCRVLTERFKNYKAITIMPYAVSDTIGTASFYIQNPGSAYNTMSKKWKESLEDPGVNRWEEPKKFNEIAEVPTTTLDTIIKEHGKPSFIKIDVEGHELACINGLSEKIGIISFEANLPEFTGETIEIVKRLKHIDAEVRFNYMGEGSSFEASQYLTADDFIHFLQNTRLRYMEIYSFMKTA